MPTRSRRLLLLLELPLAAVVMGLLTSTAISSNVADLQAERWRVKLPDVAMPEVLAVLLSPLTRTQLHQFSLLLNNKDARATFNATQFCSSADLLCSQHLPILARNTFSHGNRHFFADENHMFVDKKELREGGEMTMPDLNPPITWKSFLPSELAEMMPPLLRENLSQILRLFNIPRNTNLSRNIASALEMCEGSVEEGEERRCTTSVEGTVEYVVSLLGSDVEVVSDPSTVGSGERAKVTKARGREKVKGKPPISCHNFVFPYGLFYCHSFEGSDIFDLQLEVTLEGKKVTKNFTAICHYFSEGGSGKQASCHGIYGSTLLFLPTATNH